MLGLRKISKVFLILFVLFLAGCNVSKEEAVNRAKEIFQTSFEQEQNTRKTKLEQVELYIPKGVKLVEESEYNLLLEHDGQPFILFFNPLEPTDSKVNLLHDQEMEQDAILFETLEQKGQLGYLVISPDEGDQLRLIIGHGGAKITTISDKTNVEESVELAVKMLHSLSYGNEDTGEESK